MRRGCCLEIGHILCILPVINCTYLCYFPDHDMPLNLPPLKFQRAMKTRFTILCTPAPFICCPCPNSLSTSGWNLLHSLDSPPLIFLAIHWSFTLFVCHHLTCLPFRGIMERPFLPWNSWDLNFLREISIWENAYTHRNSPFPKRNKTKRSHVCNVCAELLRQ